MAITKNNDNTYNVDVSKGYVNGKRIRLRRKNIKTLKEAKEIEAKLRTENSLQENKEITFQKAFEKYMIECKIEEEKQNLRDTTLASKESIFRIHILPIFKDKYITQIHKKEILKFQEILLTKNNIHNIKKKLSNETLRKIFKQLNAFFNYCVKEDLIQINPCNKVSNFKKEKKEKDYLTIEEFYKLIENVKRKRDYTILHLLYFSGIRISELLGLSLDTVQIEEKNPYIQINKTCSKGKLKKETKNETSKDKVYIDQLTQEILSNYIKSTEFISYNSKYLFPSFNSKSKIITERTIRDMIKKYCKMANINKKITPHTFRHSHAAMLIAMGHTLEDIKNRLRHASIKTTSDEYGHMYESRKKDLALNITAYAQEYQKNK